MKDKIKPLISSTFSIDSAILLTYLFSISGTTESYSLRIICMHRIQHHVSQLCRDSQEEYENLHPLIMKHTGARYMDANPHTNQNNFFHNTLVHSVIFSSPKETTGGTIKTCGYREFCVSGINLVTAAVKTFPFPALPVAYMQGLSSLENMY